MIDNDLNESGPVFPEWARHRVAMPHERAWRDAAAMDRRDAAFRLAFRRCGGILPRHPGCAQCHDGIGKLVV